MVARFVIAAVTLVLVVGGSTAGAQSSEQLWSIYLKVVSWNSNVSLSPQGALYDPECPNNVCRFRYPAGTTVTLKAVPVGSSSFEGWQQLYSNRPTSCTGTFRVCTLTMDYTKYAKAAFSPVRLWPSSSNGGGHVEVEGGLSCGQGCYSFGYNDEATVWAVAHDGFHFDGWGSPCESVTTDGCSIPMYDNISVRAYFKRNDGLGTGQYPLTEYVGFKAYIRGTGTGTITGPKNLSCPGRCGMDYEQGRQIALTATATGGSRFGGWAGACVNATGLTCVFRAVPTSSGGGRWAAAYFSRP